MHEKWVGCSDEKKEAERKVKNLEKEVKDLGQQLSNTKDALAN